MPIAYPKVDINRNILIKRKDMTTGVIYIYVNNTFGFIRDEKLIVTMLNISKIPKEVNLGHP